LPPILDSHAEVVALIKPQFEVGKSNLNNKGIVKDAKLYNVIIDKVKQVAAELEFKVSQVVDSPILGGDGNKEFLIHLQRIA
jgi:23S rRNA (cytidine1920-2'-O)/16S rRNA (cytidine1409-2'-O)-methyltransferase